VLSTTRLPTRLRYADSLEIATLADNGQRRAVSLDEVKSLKRDDVQAIEIGLPASILRKVEILDTPGFADPYHDAQQILDVMDQAELAIWCTLASQAWRRSEQLAWLSLPERLREQGLLVVTHVDQLRHHADRAQLEARLEHQAGPCFHKIISLSLPDANRARPSPGSEIDQRLWRSSGGAALFATLEAMLSTVTGQREGAADPTSRPAPGPARPRASSDGAAIPPVTQDGSDAGPGRGMTRDVEGMLEEAKAATNDCLLAAYVDMGARRVLAVRSAQPTSPDFEALIVAMTSALLQGDGSKATRELIGADRSNSQSKRDAVQEMTVQTDRTVHWLLRQPRHAERAIVIVCARPANLSVIRLRLLRRLTALALSDETTTAAQGDQNGVHAQA
jgi:hypothetical protein